MAVNGNIPVKRGVLPEGEAGIDETISRMVRMAHGKYGSKSAKIRALGIDILNKAKVPDKDYYGMIIAIHNWVRDKIRYIHDPLGQETISYPEETAFNSGAGDCDDKTILEIALLGSLGIQSWPVVYGRAPGKYSHVYLRAQVPPGRHRYAGKVVSLDPIMREWPAGREAQGGFKKEYRQFSQGTTTMDGLGHLGIDSAGMMPGMDGVDAGMMPGMDGLGAYAQAPSYLPGDVSAKEVELMAGKSKRGPQSMTTPVSPGNEMNPDGSVANSNQVSVPGEAIDGYFLPADGVANGTVKVPGEEFGPTAAAKQQVAARYTRYGQLQNTMPTIYPAGHRALTGDGPMTAEQARKRTHLLPDVGVTKLTPMKAGLKTGRANTNGIRTRGPQHVMVNDRPMLPEDTKGRALQEAVKTPAEEAEELDGLANVIAMTAQQVELAGLGSDPIGKGFNEETVDRVATLSWYAEWKKSLMKAVSDHATEVRKHIEALVKNGQQEPVSLAKAKDEEEAAKTLQKAAEEVEKSAKTVEKAIAKNPETKARIAAQKQALSKAEAEKGTPSAVDSLPAAKAQQIDADQAKGETAKAEIEDGMRGVGLYAAPQLAGLGEAVAKNQMVGRRFLDRLRQFWARYRPGDARKAADNSGTKAATTAAAKTEIIRREGRGRLQRARRAQMAIDSAQGVRAEGARRRRGRKARRQRMGAPALQVTIKRLQAEIPRMANPVQRQEAESMLAQLRSELHAETRSHRPSARSVGAPKFKAPVGLDDNLKRRDVALRNASARKLATTTRAPASVEGLGAVGLSTTQMLVGGVLLAGSYYLMKKKR